MIDRMVPLAALAISSPAVLAAFDGSGTVDAALLRLALALMLCKIAALALRGLWAGYFREPDEDDKGEESTADDADDSQQTPRRRRVDAA